MLHRSPKTYIKSQSSEGPYIRRRQFKLAALIAGALALLAGGKLTQTWLEGRDRPLPLVLKWEGLWIDDNFRDAGASLNRCLGQPVFRESTLLRSAMWFSGWSCEHIGNPDVIYSLNFNPAAPEEYFCSTANQPVVGRHFNETKLNDLEFLATWSDPAMVASTCGFFEDALRSVAVHQRILVHCEAGRDRTGTVIAMMAALAAESRALLDDRLLDAIECDYRHSASLKTHKYGRMKTFLSALQAQGGIAKFLEERCHTSPELLQAGATALLAN